MLLHPDPDDPQLPFLDPTQYRYELIRPLLLYPEHTATQRAQETGTHPETVGRLKRRFDQQGMLGPSPVAEAPRATGATRNASATEKDVSTRTVAGRHPDLV